MSFPDVPTGARSDYSLQIREKEENARDRPSRYVQGERREREGQALALRKEREFVTRRGFEQMKT